MVKKKFCEIDLFDLTSFFGLDFFLIFWPIVQLYDFTDEVTRNPKRKCKKTGGGKSSAKHSNTNVENSGFSQPSSQENNNPGIFEIDDFEEDSATSQEKIRKVIGKKHA